MDLRTSPWRRTLMPWMLGECSGKTRSTPSSLTIRRTVNIWLMPLPLRLITTPLKIWMRSFSPSTILTDTSTVSPISKVAASFFRFLASTASINAFRTAGLLHLHVASENAKRFTVTSRRQAPIAFTRHSALGTRHLSSGPGDAAASACGPAPISTPRPWHGRRLSALPGPPARETRAGGCIADTRASPARPRPAD